MKPEYEIIPQKAQSSFIAKTTIRENRPRLSQAWHYHPEIEICFTRIGSGKRFVGNQISDFKEKDLVMFGSNLPHGFTTDMFSYQDVIQMNYDFLGLNFWNKPESKKIKSLFEKSKAGIHFEGTIVRKAEVLINKIQGSEGLQKLIHLLSLLEILASSSENRFICNDDLSLNFDKPNLDRVNIIYEHIMVNYQNEVNIKDVADILGLSEVAFFKFMKKHTKKTYTQLINEFRINHASKMLINTDETISRICFESGFKNVSYFNRKFKQLMNKTPLEFRNQYEE